MKFIFLLLMAFSSAAIAESELLVSAEEMRASNAAPDRISPKSTIEMDAPTIEILFPKLPGNVASPTSINLKFIAVAPSRIKPETFKALYGTLQIDITKKLLKLARLTDAGIQVLDAALPIGRHKILLTVEDSAGRTGGKKIEFEVN
jgi:hypothetical protein